MSDAWSPCERLLCVSRAVHRPSTGLANRAFTRSIARNGSPRRRERVIATARGNGSEHESGAGVKRILCIEYLHRFCYSTCYATAYTDEQALHIGTRYYLGSRPAKKITHDTPTHDMTSSQRPNLGCGLLALIKDR